MDGRKLAKLRDDAKLSQVRLAHMAGLDPATISQLERGIQDDPKLSTMLSLARALRCRVVDFAPELLGVPEVEPEREAVNG